MSPSPPAMATLAHALDHGLNEEEWNRALERLGRTPNLLELGILSVMWSEHCSYKSTRAHLGRLPSAAPWVIHGPGENAGVVEIGVNAAGERLAAVFKMESHNHPSFIEPFQGAATGVGGIMRDVFTMGARPIANLNALRFGAPDHPLTRRLLRGVVSGIGFYGNCTGVPTVGGELEFDPGYNDNILVNAMCVGVARAERIFLSAAAGVGNPVVYVGSATGRDGIHGATMASAEFDEDTEARRPTVQVGDPFLEKLLIEACLELMATDAIVAIQDMGAAGLTSSSVEMASKGGVGIRLDLEQVPVREEGMTPYELMLSESQERMLIVLKPGREAQAQAIFEAWGLSFATIGRIVEGHELELSWHGEEVGRLPLSLLSEAAPRYERPWEPTPPPPPLSAPPQSADLLADLLAMMGGPRFSSRRWVWEQYDHMVGADTVQRPGGNAAVVRVEGGPLALAMTADCTPRYVLADPVLGGRQAVAEAWRNLTAVGARPLAFTDCLNFGAPTRPRVMGQIVGAIEGMAEAALALDFPVVSGNCSLYNETDGRPIPPTPAIGGVGVLDDWRLQATPGFKAEGEELWLVGRHQGHLGRSAWLLDLHGRAEGPPPPVDLALERSAGDWVRSLIAEGRVSAVHDCADGGLLVALAEMAVAGGMGATIVPDAALDPAAWAFGEDQGRYVVAVPAGASLPPAPVPLARLGTTGGDRLEVSGHGAVAVAKLSEAREAFLPGLMEQPPA